MKPLCAFVLSLALFAGCTSEGKIDPNLGGRVVTDLACLGALSAAGISVAADPAIGGVTTAVAVLHAVQAAGGDVAHAGVLAACHDTLANAADDARGIAAKAKAAKASVAAPK